MFISKFCQLAARAARTPALRARTFSSAVSYSMAHLCNCVHSLPVFLAARTFSSTVSYSMAHNLYLKTQRHASFCTSAAKLDSDEGDEEPKRINVTFVDKDGEEKNISVPEGFSMLEAAHDNDIDLEGACEGTMACSTCHVIVTDIDQYNKLPDPTDEELDMLDLAFGLTKTSRLGCQVIAKRELDGLRLALPTTASL